MKKISIIVPCYNEQECILDSIDEIKLFIKILNIILMLRLSMMEAQIILIQ